MGLKANSILIRPAALPDNPPQFLESLGFRGLTSLGEQSYGEVRGQRWSRSVWIGLAGDCLILSGQGLAEPFFEPQPSQLMLQLFDLFANAEICAVALDSVVNAWGFAVFRNRRPIRRKCGDGDVGTTVDEGAPLPEEAALLSCSRLREDGTRVYRVPDFPDGDLDEDQVGENFISEICKRFTGMDMLTDAALDQVPMIGFAPPPWWKFWAK